MLAGARSGVDVHDASELRLIAAVLEGRVVMVTAEQQGPVVRQARAVEAEVRVPLVVGVGLAHAELTGEGFGGRGGRRRVENDYGLNTESQ